MKNRDITSREQSCISQCILKHWSGSSPDSRERDRSYEKCLSDCNVCG